MSAADIAINIAAQFTGKTAFDKAENSAQKLQKSVKNLGRQLGLALGTAAIVNYGKQSVKAFAADDNAARSLGKTLENLGLNTRYAGSELNGYISRLEQQTGVLDDELRPAMDRLLRATGSVTDSQKLLGLALDISAGTGKDLTAVSQGLQKAYLGNNASLGRLGVGLTKAELKSSSFIDIQTKLTTLFAGQAKDAADSFQGSLNKLTVASNNAKEAIGKGLVEALAILTGGGGTVDGAVGTIDKMSSGIASGAKNIAYMIKQFEALKPVILAVGAALLIAFAPVVAAVAALGFILAKGGSNLKKSAFARGEYANGAIKTPLSISGQTENALGKKQRLAMEKQNKILDTGNKLKTIDNNATARKITLTGDELALKELEKKFDVERIGLYAALNQSTDEETKMRLLSKIAIYDQNTALAGMIKKANEAEDAFKTLIEALRLTVRGMLDRIAPELRELQILTGNTPAAGGGYSAADVNTQSIAAASLNQGLGAGLSTASALSGARYAAQAAANYVVSVNVAGSVTTERDLVSAITQGIVNNQASGIPVTYSTAFK
jgi:hypothetical protein